MKTFISFSHVNELFNYSTLCFQLNLENLTEGAELCKSIGARFSAIDFRKRKTKSNGINHQMMEFLHDICDGQVQPITSNANSEMLVSFLIDSDDEALHLNLQLLISVS